MPAARPHATATRADVARSNSRALSKTSKPRANRLYEATYGRAWPTSASKAGAVLTSSAANTADRVDPVNRTARAYVAIAAATQKRTLTSTKLEYAPTNGARTEPSSAYPANRV